ncbi:hypothetical protein J2R76_003664 [Bradyrhizobium sp. USDA 4532]|nr:hypothetical protein [Bradyrhizobium sp. USDA 4545]MCP1920073.1 hypothetical protein [Bradyrhizobium sp. USDA 4532]
MTPGGKEPTNLAFGGSDGKTVFVTQRQGGFFETFLPTGKGASIACRVLGLGPARLPLPAISSSGTGSCVAGSLAR